MNVERIMSGVRTVSATGGNLNLSRPIGEQIPYRTIDVLYKRNIQSGIIFYTDEFFSDEYGNINAIDKIVYTGHFGQLGAGDMLPLNYQSQTP